MILWAVRLKRFCYNALCTVLKDETGETFAKADI